MFDFARSTWNSDKYFRGSYAFMPLGSEPIDLENMAAPIQIDNVRIKNYVYLKMFMSINVRF